MEKHIYFVRHGESDSNAERVYRGDESLLTEKGRGQAESVAGRIERIGVDALISSTFPRALHTAEEISKKIGISVESSELFVEWREPRIIYGRHFDEPEVNEIHKKMVNRHEDPHHRVYDEETFAELKERGIKALEFLETHSTKSICVVTHGAFLRILVGIVLYREAFGPSHFKDLFHHMITTNTGVTYIRNTNPEYGWQLLTWNDSAHLG